MSSRPIVVGYHGTDACRSALLWAMRHARPDQPIVAVAAIGHERALTPALPGEADRCTQQLRAGWDQDGAVLDDAVELVVTGGRPSEVIVRLADERDAEHIVVGHERHRFAARHPSVAEHVARVAGCPVTIVTV